MQSVSKSGGSWIRPEKLFNFIRKKFSIFPKKLRFPRQFSTTFFSRQLKKLFLYHLSQKRTLSFSLENNHLPTYFQSKIRYSIFPVPSTTPLRPPTTPTTPAPNLKRFDPLNPPDLHPFSSFN